MLSAYELNNFTDPILLAQTEILANKLVYAWEDNNPFPYSTVNFEWNEPYRQVVSDFLPKVYSVGNGGRLMVG